MEEKKATKIIKILRISEIVFAVVLLALIFILQPNVYCFGIIDVLSLLYTAWLMFVAWAGQKYQPQKKAGLWEILAIIAVGCLVLFKVLYTANP